MYTREDLKRYSDHIPVSENEVTPEIISTARKKGITLRIVPEEYEHLSLKDGLLEYLNGERKERIL